MSTRLVFLGPFFRIRQTNRQTEKQIGLLAILTYYIFAEVSQSADRLLEEIPKSDYI